MFFFLCHDDIDLGPVPPLRHQKNTIEPNNGSKQSIFLRSKSADDKLSDSVLAIRAIRISNDMNGSDLFSSFKMENGFLKPLMESRRPIPVDGMLKSLHGDLIGKRKLRLISRSNSYSSDIFKPEDMLKVLLKTIRQNIENGLHHDKL